MRVTLPLLLSLALMPPALAQSAVPPSIDYDTAIIGALDKITGRQNRFPAPVGYAVPFGGLRIGVRACRKTPPEEYPEAAAYLEIDEVREVPGQEAKTTTASFRGWMFASSPAISAMQHAVYDVWLVDCRNRGASAPE